MTVKQRIKGQADKAFARVRAFWSATRAQLMALCQKTGLEAWYAYQSAEDRLILRTTGCWALIIAGLILAWVALQRQLSVSESAHTEAIQVLRSLRQHRPQRQNQQNQPLVTALLNSARRYQVSLAQFQPQGEHLVSITTTDTSFQQLVKWLQHLDRLRIARVEQANIGSLNRRGSVSAQFVFESL